MEINDESMENVKDDDKVEGANTPQFLTPEEIVDYANRNMGLVHTVALQYKAEGYGLSYDDAFSIALSGFHKALQKFDKSNGSKFSTYAWTVITNEILSSMRSDRKHIDRTVSFEETIHKDNSGSELRLENVLSNEGNGDLGTEETILLGEDISLLREMILTLTPQEQEIITRRYGIGRPQETQKVIAKDMNMSQANISKIEKNILSKLYVRMRGSMNSSIGESNDTG